MCIVIIVSLHAHAVHARVGFARVVAHEAFRFEHGAYALNEAGAHVGTIDRDGVGAFGIDGRMPREKGKGGISFL